MLSYVTHPMDKEKAIIGFARRFYCTLTERCIKSCGRAMGTLELPVFKKFLSYRVNRELEFNEACLSTASVLYENNLALTTEEIDELTETTKLLDKKLLRDIKLLPLRISYDYKRIIPIRRKRIEILVNLFLSLLRTEGTSSYDEMVYRAFEMDQYLDINNEILELYSEEAFIINSTIKSIIKIDTETLAQRMYCMMIDVGYKLNREIAERIYLKR